MDIKSLSFRLIRLASLLIILVIVLGNSLTAQEKTIVKGKVYDARTKEPLAFVDVIFKGTYVGASTDLDGQYLLNTKIPSDSISASYLGYKTMTKAIERGKRQTIHFYLEEEGVVADAVTITSKKGRYRKKGNPAVELIKKVTANKDRNRIENEEFYNYKKHEKIELDLNNITEEFTKKKQFRNFQFLWNYLDTSELNGRAYLPLYLREVISNVHYRKDPESKKELREAIKMTNFDEAIDLETINSGIDIIYDEVDIYENSIKLLDNDFLSPLAPWGVNYYRYYIQDTVELNNQSAIQLAFIPRNKTFIGFTGDLYISNDDKYTVLKANLGITKDISLNFVRDLKIIQEFEEINGVYVLTKDQMTIDMSPSNSGIGVYANRTNLFEDYDFNQNDNLDVYKGAEDIKLSKDAYDKSEAYWVQNRISALSEKEENIYELVDTLVTVPAYKRLVFVTKVLATGYIEGDYWDVGDLGAFLAFNDVEGWRPRFGGETSHKLSKKWQAEAYVAYGLRDKEFTYEGAFMYTFNEDWKKNPKNFLKATYTHDVIFPGLQLEFIEADNFLTSIRRGEANQLLFLDKFSLEYFVDKDIGFFKFGLDRMGRRPYGTLQFLATRNDEQVVISNINTFEFSFAGEYSPNATFLQGRKNRVPVVDNVPRFQFSYTGAYSGILGGEYTYHKLAFIAKKRIPLSVVGRSLTEAEVGGVIANELPYILLYIPRANQSFSFQRNSFNTMNFLEFAADKYIRFSYQHFFDGYLLNRIPLIRKLGLKEIITAKIIWGSLSDKHNPELNPELIQFSTNPDNGESFTNPLEADRPFLEYGIGISNIFKFIRVDMVKRANYLEHQNVENLFNVRGLGLRVKLKVEF